MEQFHNSGLWKLQNFYLVPQFTFGKVDPNFRSVWRRGGFAKIGKTNEFWCLYMQPDKMYSSKVSKLYLIWSHKTKVLVRWLKHSQYSEQSNTINDSRSRFNHTVEFKRMSLPSLPSKQAVQILTINPSISSEMYTSLPSKQDVETNTSVHLFGPPFEVGKWHHSLIYASNGSLTWPTQSTVWLKQP